MKILLLQVISQYLIDLLSIQLRQNFTLVSDICLSLLSFDVRSQTCLSSKNRVRLNINPKTTTKTIIILVLLTVQIERAFKGLQTTMNLENIVIH